MISKRTPLRTCIACGKKDSRNALLRIALSDGDLTWDERRRLPGRGAYVCGNPGCRERVLANHRRCLDRAFHPKRQEVRRSDKNGGRKRELNTRQ